MLPLYPAAGPDGAPVGEYDVLLIPLWPFASDENAPAMTGILRRLIQPFGFSTLVGVGFKVEVSACVGVW